jgi:putative hemolysin
MVVMILCVVMFGCSKPINDSSSQLANPASVFCEDNGGTLSIVTEKNGQVGICTLSDGSKCDEWEYYRGECGESDTGSLTKDSSVQTEEITDTIQMANPATTNCIKNGGKLEIITDSEGGQSGMCILTSGIKCEE